MDFSLLAAMALFAFVTSVTPGPNNLMLLVSGAAFGFKKTIPHMLGISCGHFVMLLAVGAGLEQLLTMSPRAYPPMKIVGFAYVLYMAWGIARSTPPCAGQAARAHRPLGFVGAALFQWVNPKAWLMAIAYFGNYMPVDATTSFIAATCAMFSLINLPSISLWALLGLRLQAFLQNDARRRIFNSGMAAALVIAMLPVLFV
jgi:threonine/homoserine/homoserine lactone efflux protein